MARRSRWCASQVSACLREGLWAQDEHAESGERLRDGARIGHPEAEIAIRWATNGNSKVAVGVATLASGGKGAFGSPSPGVDLICDGSSHAYEAFVGPDLQTDPFTAALTGGQATATLSLTLFTFACPPCFSPTTTTVTTGSVEIRIKG